MPISVATGNPSLILALLAHNNIYYGKDIPQIQIKCMQLSPVKEKISKTSLHRQHYYCK